MCTVVGQQAAPRYPVSGGRWPEDRETGSWAGFSGSIPQFYPLWPYFLEGWVWEMCVPGLRLAFLLFLLLLLRKGARPRIAVVDVSPPVFFHLSEAWSTD